MSTKKNKKQHYISVFYLYNFTNIEQRKLSQEKKRATKIWHYDKRKKCIKERPIENIATAPYLFSFINEKCEYDHRLDEKLIKVESNAAASFSELCDIKASLKKGIDKTININDSLLNNILTFIVWQMRRHPSLVNCLHQQCEEHMTKRNVNLNPKEMALTVIEKFGRDSNFNFEYILRAKNKRILFTTTPLASFITTDEPVVRFNKSSTDGIGIENTEIYFPLASNMLLVLYGKGDKKEFRKENCRSFLRSINSYLAKKAKNYIFGSSKEHIEIILKNIK